MQNIAAIEFVDRDSEDNAWMFVRAGTGFVALSLSLQRDGDLEVAFGVDECKRLIAALTEALRTSEDSSLYLDRTIIGWFSSYTPRPVLADPAYHRQAKSQYSIHTRCILKSSTSSLVHYHGYTVVESERQ